MQIRTDKGLRERRLRAARDVLVHDSSRVPDEGDETPGGKGILGLSRRKVKLLAVNRRV